MGLIAVAAVWVTGPRIERPPIAESAADDPLRVMALGQPLAGATLQTWSALEGWTVLGVSDIGGYFTSVQSVVTGGYVVAPGWARQRVLDREVDREGGREVRLIRSMPLAGVVRNIADEPVPATIQAWRLSAAAPSTAIPDPGLGSLEAFEPADLDDEPTDALPRHEPTLIAEAPFETQANAEGSFSFDDVEGGAVRLVISAPGYAREVVMPGAGRHAVRIVLTPAATLAGVVRDVDGHPAREAEVIVAGSGFWPPRHYRTDDDGRFRIDDVPPGVYETWARSGSQRSPTRSGVRLETGDSEFVTLAMLEGEIIAGRVINSDGEGVADVELLLTGGGNSLTPIKTRTNRSGAFSLEGLLPVPFSRTLLIRTEAYLPAEISLNGPQTDVEIVLRRGAVLRGQVVDDRGRGVEGAHVRWSMSEGASPRGSSSLGRTGRTDLHNLGVTVGPVPPIPYGDSPPALRGYGDATTGADGRFVLTAVLPGQGELSASHPDYASGRALELTVVESESRSELQLQVRDGGILYGRVVDIRGFPVGDLPVELATDDRTIPTYRMVGEDGAFEFRGVLGAVTLTARPYDAPAARQTFFVEAGQQREVTLTLESALGALAGRLRDDHGFWIDDAEIRLTSTRNETPFERQTSAEPDGTFSFVALPPPPYSLVVDAPGFALLEVDVLPSHDPARTLSLTLLPGVDVIGQVLDEWNDLPVIGARITLRVVGQNMGQNVEGNAGQELDDIQTTHSAMEGRFRFARQSAGMYWVQAEYEGRTASAEVKLNAPLARLAPLLLPSAGNIEVSVVDALGDPAPASRIVVDDVEVQAGPAGMALIQGLEPGLHLVSAHHDHAGVAQSVRVRVVATETSELRLTLNGRMPLGSNTQAGPGVSIIAESTNGQRTGDETGRPETETGPSRQSEGVAIRIARSGMRVIIAAVTRGSLAYRAGLRAGDVLLQIEGEDVLSAGTARAQLRGPSGRVRLLVERNGRRIRRTVQREHYVVP